jgi:hypothetical protein
MIPYLHSQFLMECRQRETVRYVNVNMCNASIIRLSVALQVKECAVL